MKKEEKKKEFRIAENFTKVASQEEQAEVQEVVEQASTLRVAEAATEVLEAGSVQEYEIVLAVVVAAVTEADSSSAPQMMTGSG